MRIDLIVSFCITFIVGSILLVKAFYEMIKRPPQKRLQKSIMRGIANLGAMFIFVSLFILIFLPYGSGPLSTADSWQVAILLIVSGLCLLFLDVLVGSIVPAYNAKWKNNQAVVLASELLSRLGGGMLGIGLGLIWRLTHGSIR